MSSTSDKVFGVLKLFTETEPEWSVEEASAALGLNKSSAYRYFSSLVSAGFLAPRATGRYILGPEIIRLDWQLRRTDPTIALAGPEMERIARIYPGKITVVLVRLLGDQVMSVHQANAGKPTPGISFERGRPMPLFAGSVSKIILANLPTRRLKAMHARQPEPFAEHGFGADWPSVLASIQKLRTDGYCVATGEVDPGLRGVSVPLFGASNAVQGSLTAVGQIRNVDDAVVNRLIIELTRCARLVERSLQSTA